MMLLGTLVGSIRYNSLSVTLCKIFIIRNSNLMFCLFVKVQSHMHARQHVASEMTNHASSENMVIVMFALHIGLHIFLQKVLKAVILFTAILFLGTPVFPSVIHEIIDHTEFYLHIFRF